MIKIDLHTHSEASPDGGIKPEQYANALENGGFDYIAVTDHDSINTALSLQESLGDRIIIGEEISTTQGEIVGLYLTQPIAPGQSPIATTRAIKQQGGIVYIPHPFETVRSGLSEKALDSIVHDVDIVEVHNGRAVFQNCGPQAARWAKLNHKVIAASSDAHGAKGLGTTYTLVSEKPNKQNIIKALQKARYVTNRPPLRTLLYPKAHRLRKKLGGKK